MARTIYLGKTNKRINSTLQPDWSGTYTAFDVVFKEGFDIRTPRIILSHDGLLPAYNHMYIPDVDMYYWITAQRAVQNNRWEISAEVDTLATYRNAIVNTTAFIEYGFNSNAGAAGYRVQDTRPAIVKQPVVTTVKFGVTDAVVDAQNGVYILSAVGKSDGVQSYALNRSQVHKLLNQVNSDISTAIEGKDTMEELFAYFSANSLFQASAVGSIKNCVWLPFKLSVIGGASKRIYLGDFDTGVDAKEITQDLFNFAMTGALQWPADDWKRLNTQILLYVPFFGTVAVPVDQCNNATSLKVQYSLDCLAGNLAVKVTADTYTVYTSSTNVSAPYSIGSSNVPVQNVVNGTLTAVGSGIEAGKGIYTAAVDPRPSAKISGASQAVSGAQGVFNGVTQAITPVVQCAGGVGGSPAAGIDQEGTVTYIYYPPIDAESLQAIYGYPVMRMGTPAAGYCKTRGFSLQNSTATADEMNAINTAIDSGVFIDV